MSLNIDLQLFVKGGQRQTNFTTSLIELIFKADGHNLRLLEKSFPNAVKTIDHYRATGEFLDLNYD